MAIGDFNQDGDPDVAVVNRDSADVSVLTGAAGASLTLAATVPVAATPQAIVTGDFNQDGDPDLAVSSGAANVVTVFTGGTGAGFTTATVAVPNFPVAMTIGDFDGNGDPDIAVTQTQFQGRLAVLVGVAGSSSFTLSPTTSSVGDSAFAIVAADFSEDGDPDIAVASLLLSKISILLGQANSATFAPSPEAESFATGSSPRAIVAGRFDPGVDPDLAVANQGSDDVTILAGAVSPRFSAPLTVTVGDEPSGIAVADFNADGDSDLAVSNEASASPTGSVSILLGSTAATFTPGPGSPVLVGARPLALAAADFNADGHLDLATADGGADTVSILLGNGVTPPPGSDSTPPETTIDKGPKAKTEKTKAKIRYSANEPATFECKLKGKGVDRSLRSFTDCAAAKVKYKRLDPGKKKFQVRAIDAVGNVDPSPAKLRWKVLR